MCSLKKYCDYCNQWVEVSNHHQWMAHRSNCINNPNRSGKLKNMSAAKKRRDSVKKYDFYCIKCGKKYSIELTKYAYRNGNYRKHCSRSCANSHIQTPEQNNSRKEKLKGRLVGINRYRKRKPILSMVCNLCKEEFFTKDKKRKYCSKVCASRGNIKRAWLNIDRRAIVKEQYRNGKMVYGGTTKWYSYGDIKVQGTYELLVCYILDLWKTLGKIKDWEYTNDRFPYIGSDGKEHTYLVDFKVFSVHNFYYVEVKGYERENDKVKWSSVKDNGYYLEIWDLDTVIKNGMGMVVPG